MSRLMAIKYATGGRATHTSVPGVWLELRRLPPIIGFVGSAPGLVTLLA